MSVKSELRKSLLVKRKAICNKKEKDRKINEYLINSDIFLNSSVIFFYAPTADEIDISYAIDIAVNMGKKIAFPKCTDKDGNMEFYFVNSYDDLVKGTFGIMEPDPDKSILVTDFSDALCVVPALSVDDRGYRIGYGKGYYDRFLQKNSLISNALCYNELQSKEIPNDEYDISVDYIITDTKILQVMK